MIHGVLEEITDLSIWDNLVLKSPHATRFVDRSLLEIFDVPVKYYGLMRKGMCLVGLPVIDASSYNSDYLPQCYYQGPIFHNELYNSSLNKQTQYELQLAEESITQLARVEDEFHFSLHPSLLDIRGYFWVHYHEKDKNRCKITPCYTATIDIGNLSSKSIRSNSRSARRQEEGYARKRENLEVSDGGTIGELIALYMESFKRQGTDVSIEEKKFLQKFCKYFLNLGIGKILTIRNTSREAVAAALIFCDYNKTWHVPLVGVGNTRYGGTLLYYYIADIAKNAGGKNLDFNGANSPSRSYFKHSIGARPKLYFTVSYKKTGTNV